MPPEPRIKASRFIRQNILKNGRERNTYGGLELTVYEVYVKRFHAGIIRIIRYRIIGLRVCIFNEKAPCGFIACREASMQPSFFAEIHILGLTLTEQQAVARHAPEKQSGQSFCRIYLNDCMIGRNEPSSFPVNATLRRVVWGRTTQKVNC
jgi:hypothetical protein